MNPRLPAVGRKARLCGLEIRAAVTPMSGALGAAIWSRALEQGWVQRQMGTRAIVVTDTGRSAFHQQLGISLD